MYKINLKKDQHDPYILFAVLAIVLFGALMVYSTTALRSIEVYNDSHKIFFKHIFSIIIGSILFFLFSKINPLFYQKHSFKLIILGIFALILVRIPGISHHSGGATRWINIFGFQFQPGELVKLLLAIYFATYISRHHDKMRDFGKGIINPFIVLALFSLLLLSQPDFGSTAVIAILLFVQLITVVRLRYLTGLALFGLLSGAILIMTSTYRMKRIESFLNPFENSSGSGYQLVQSLIAIGSGGVSGIGMGESKQKLYYLPAAHTDFIFSVITEELGIIAGISIVLIFTFIAYRGFLIAKNTCDDPYLSSLAIGCTTLTVLPAFLNIGVCTGLLPTKGMVLPLIAYGGSAMIIQLSNLGILYGISKFKNSST